MMPRVWTLDLKELITGTGARIFEAETSHFETHLYDIDSASAYKFAAAEIAASAYKFTAVIKIDGKIQSLDCAILYK